MASRFSKTFDPYQWTVRRDILTTPGAGTPPRHVQWSKHPSKNCYQANGKGATDVAISGGNHGHGDCRKDVASAEDCKDLCLQSDGCEAVVYFYTFCCARKDVNLPLCDSGGPYTTYTSH